MRRAAVYEEKEVLSLAKKLKSFRDELHLTQKEVADKAKITESTYRAYELGDRNPKPEIMDRIAKVLGGETGVPQCADVQE